MKKINNEPCLKNRERTALRKAITQQASKICGGTDINNVHRLKEVDKKLRQLNPSDSMSEIEKLGINSKMKKELKEAFIKHGVGTTGEKRPMVLGQNGRADVPTLVPQEQRQIA